jgi:hypothetical protein
MKRDLKDLKQLLAPSILVQNEQSLHDAADDVIPGIKYEKESVSTISDV